MRAPGPPGSSAKPELRMTAALMPARPQRSSSAGTNSAGTISIAKSVGCGSASTDG
jgi:hypothetical protein